MKIDIKIIKNESDFQSCLFIRKQVFIIGQNISEELELDDNLFDLNHILATINNQAVGTARWRKIDHGIKLERFAVLDEFQNMGVGKAMVNFILDYLKHDKYIYLNAQESVIKFYEKLGFISKGEIFYEQNIPHQKMVFSS